MKNRYSLIVGTLVSIIMVCSCSAPKDVTYTQDITQGTYSISQLDGTIKARPDDKLQITVNSKDPALAALFNLRSETGTGSNTMLYYTVDPVGNIDFPLVGEVHVAGLTRAEIASEIKNILISRDLIKDPNVNVEFHGNAVSVMGEVNTPGRIELKKDHVTILEVIAMAGDLTIYGERENVAVFRKGLNGKQEVYRVNLTSAESIYGSPAYYMQQDDIIYVEPNDTRKRMRSANGNNILTPTFWISIASFIASMAVLIWK